MALRHDPWRDGLRRQNSWTGGGDKRQALRRAPLNTPRQGPATMPSKRRPSPPARPGSPPPPGPPLVAAPTAPPQRVPCSVPTPGATSAPPPAATVQPPPRGSTAGQMRSHSAAAPQTRSISAAKQRPPAPPAQPAAAAAKTAEDDAVPGFMRGTRASDGRRTSCSAQPQRRPLVLTLPRSQPPNVAPVNPAPDRDDPWRAGAAAGPAPTAPAPRLTGGGDRDSQLVRFWRGEVAADCVCGCARMTVDQMLTKRGDYNFLEYKHHYIQWLFPKEQSGVAGALAPPLRKDDAKQLMHSAACRARVIGAYRMMLDFWGLELANEHTGELRLAPHCDERFQNIEQRPHNYLRITRVIISLGIFKLHKLVMPFVETLLSLVAGGRLPGARTSLLRYWIPACRGHTPSGRRCAQVLTQHAAHKGLRVEDLPAHAYYNKNCRAALR